MVNPPGQSAGSAIAGLQLHALSSDSLRYLGQQVGKVIEARVTQVIIQLPVDTSPAHNKTAPGELASARNNTKGNAPTNTGNNVRADTRTETRGNTLPNPAERYELRLSIDNKHTLKVESPLAPRIGQLLQLAVIDNQQLQIIGTGGRGASSTGQNIAASLSSATTSNTAMAAQQNAGAAVQRSDVATQPALNIDSTRPITLGTSPSNNINSPLSQALRDALPKQLGRAELGSALKALVAGRAGTQQSSPAPITTTTPGTATPATAASTAIAPAATSVGSLTNTQPLPAVNQGAAVQQSPGATISSNPKPVAFASGIAPPQSPLPRLNTTAQLASAQLGAAIADGRSLADPANVREALLNSGLFYERKLANFATALRARQSVAGAASDATQKVSSQQSSQPLSLEPGGRTELLENLRGDLKHHALTLARELRAMLPTQLPGTAVLAADPAQGERSAETVLANLWQIAGSGASLSQTSESRQQLDPVLQLLRMALGSSARTQAHQLVALGSQFASQADPQINQFLNVELPFWLGQRLSLVEVRIEREKAAREARQKIETWNVRLRFDMEEMGELTALATLQGKRMAAVLWASGDHLAQVIQRELNQVTQQLTEHGLDVQHLQCRTGAAPVAAEHSAINVMNMSLLDTQS